MDGFSTKTKIWIENGTNISGHALRHLAWLLRLRVMGQYEGLYVRRTVQSYTTGITVVPRHHDEKMRWHTEFGGFGRESAVEKNFN